mgnify:CR=1 FL=1
MSFIMKHVCIRVENLEESIEFYTKALGFEVSSHRDFPEGEFTLVFLKDAGSGVEIELTYNYGHGPYTIGDGFSHIAMASADLEASYAWHKEQGYQVSEPGGLSGGIDFYFIEDPDGYEVEIVRQR